jgi:glycosyltransferase involved in cell wall biosynthesis
VKICFVSPFQYPMLAQQQPITYGGAEIQQALLGRALQRHGYDVSFIVGDCGQRQVERWMGLTIFKAPFRFLGGSNRYFFIDTVKFIQIVKRVAADAYILKLPNSLLASLGAYRAVWPCKLIKWYSQDEDSDVSVRRLTDCLYPIGLRFTDAVVFQSEQQRKAATLGRGITSRVIPNIAHDEETSHKDASITFDVLWVGSCIPSKRPELLLQIARQLPKVSFGMVIRAGADEEYNRRVADAASRIPNLVNVGALDYAKTSNYYSNAQLFLHTSAAEGFPNVFLQAWQAGIPVISLTSDPDSVIGRNSLGRVSHTPERAVTDIVEVLSNAELRRSVEVSCRRYLKRSHDPAVICAGVDELLKEIRCY